ncbi:thioredoxin family protein [Acinetobacter sp. MB5]|uniref:thioredoxin family protein n=1 Tax=Acinetobacter sp. MB5 TaxID=2069438 RepID=UPI0013A6C03B|nr:thioredoxin family protein [Acinetobacter sp. MB5]
MSVKEIKTDDFNTLIAEPGLKLFRFWAVWCPPCKAMAPMYKQAAEAIGTNALLGEINVDLEPDLAAMHGIRSIPTTVIYKEGKELTRFSGIMSAKQIADLVDSYK